VVVFLQWQCCVSSGIDNLAASSLFLAAFCHRIYKNQPAEVFYGARIIFFTQKHASQKIKTINQQSVLWCQDHFSPGHSEITICRCRQVDFIFVFMERQQTPLQKKASSGSCGGPFPEASGSPYLEGGGIRRLVAAGMPPECHHYRGWVDCSHFCGAGKVPYNGATLIYFLFLRQGNRCHHKKMTIKHASSGSCGSWFLHHHVKNNLETINLQHWWWCFCSGNTAPPAALTTLPHPSEAAIM